MRVLVLSIMVVGLLMAFASLGSAAKDESLVLYYAFEEDRGDTIVDQSGNGNDATRKRFLLFLMMELFFLKEKFGGKA